MTNGTVTSFQKENGAGFIQPDDDSCLIYIHIATVRQAGLDGLAEGQKVSFDRCSGPYGTWVARNLALRP